MIAFEDAFDPRRVNWKGAALAMFSSSPRQGLRIEHIDAEAETLISYFGVEAYFEARRREREASSEAIAKDWSRVARAVARKTKRRIDPEINKPRKVDPSTI